MLSIVNTILKPVWRWVFRFLVSLAITEAIRWLLQWSISDAVEKIKDKVSTFFGEQAGHVVKDIIKIDDVLNGIFTAAFDGMDALIDAIAGEIENAMVASAGSIETIISKISFTQAIDEMVTDGMATVSQFIFDQATTIVSTLFPVETFVLFDVALQNASHKLDALEAAAMDALTAFWDATIENITASMGQINALFSTLQSTVNGTANFCNASIDTLKAHMNEACAAMDAYNDAAARQQKIDAATLFIDGRIQGADPATGLTTADLQAIQSHLEAAFILPTPSDLTIDFSAYRIDPPTINADEYKAHIDIPPNVFTFDMSPYLPDIQGKREKLSAMTDNLANFRNDLLLKIDESVPGLLKPGLEEKIKALMAIAATEALLSIKQDILDDIREKRNEITQIKSDRKQTIVDEKLRIVDALKTFERDTTVLIKPLLDPVVQEIIEELDDGILTTDEGTTVNIDDIMPDTSELDRIIARFDSNIEANESPNIGHAKKWTTSDMLRILCNHFYRYERAALIVLLLQQDCNINRDKIEELQLTWTPPDTPPIA